MKIKKFEAFDPSAITHINITDYHETLYTDGIMMVDDIIDEVYKIIRDFERGMDYMPMYDEFETESDGESNFSIMFSNHNEGETENNYEIEMWMNSDDEIFLWFSVNDCENYFMIDIGFGIKVFYDLLYDLMQDSIDK